MAAGRRCPLSHCHFGLSVRAAISGAATASLRLMPPSDSDDLAEELRDRLEARRDPLRLKEHYFWMMWHYWIRARFERCVEVCDAGIALARQLGSPPVQYPSIKALALAYRAIAAA